MDAIWGAKWDSVLVLHMKIARIKFFGIIVLIYYRHDNAYAVFPVIIRSLHDVYEMNVYMTGYVCLSVCLSVRMIQLENRWRDLDKIWYRRYAIGDCRKIVLYNFLKSVIPTWRANKLVRLDRYYRHLQ
jgi:hypothetical protein